MQMKPPIWRARLDEGFGGWPERHAYRTLTYVPTTYNMNWEHHVDRPGTRCLAGTFHRLAEASDSLGARALKSDPEAKRHMMFVTHDKGAYWFRDVRYCPDIAGFDRAFCAYSSAT